MKSLLSISVPSFFLFGCAYLMAVDLGYNEIVVSKNNSSQIGINIMLDPSGPLCGNANDVHINFSDRYGEGEFDSVSVAIKKNEELLFDVPSQVIRLEEYMGFSPFHGVSACVDSSLLSDVTISVAYGVGGLIVSVLIIDGLDEWQ